MSSDDDSDYEMSVDEDYTSSDEESSSNVDEVFSQEDSDSDEETIQQSSSFDMPWTDNGIPRPPFPFSSASGVQIQINPEDILGIFEKFFDNNLIELIVHETNRYASQHLTNNMVKLKTNSRVHKWKDTNPNEIRTLLGLLILQGLCPKPEYKLYFSRRESITTPFFPRIISERRFHLLLKFLHFTNNETLAPDSHNRKLAKVIPVLDHLKQKYMEFYIPEKDIAIDESLIGWKGRLGWKQYIPSKRKRFGIKLYALCESSTGYMYNFIIYTGQTTDYGNKYSNEPLTSRITLSLVDPLLNKGYRLFLDNYYTGVDLVDKLVKNRTDCIGTMRINRKGIPKEIKVKLKKEETVAMYRKKIMLQKWRDKKDVLMVSTIHDQTMIKVNTSRCEVEKPSCVLEYNSHMGGVDLGDNYLHFYGTTRARIKKYYMKIFHHFLNVTTLNCYHLYKKSGGTLKRLNFLLELGEQLVAKYRTQEEPQQIRSRTPQPARYSERHFPSLIPPTTKAKPTKRFVEILRCLLFHNYFLDVRSVQNRKKRKESRYWCATCHTGLCPAPCFGIYHTKK